MPRTAGVVGAGITGGCVGGEGRIHRAFENDRRVGGRIAASLERRAASDE